MGPMTAMESQRQIHRKRKRASLDEDNNAESDSTNDTAQSPVSRSSSSLFQENVIRLKSLATEFQNRLAGTPELKQSDELYKYVAI